MLQYQIEPSGGGVSEVADFSSLGAGSDGDVKKTLDTGKYWVYNGALGLWMPPEVQPSGLEIDYDGSVLPTADTPAWSGQGAVGSSSDGDILTINDNDAGDYQVYELTDAQLASSGDCGVIMRARVTSQSATLTGYKAMLSLRAGTKRAGALAMAYGPAADSGNNVTPFATSFGTTIGTVTDQSPANSGWQTYYIYYLSDENRYVMGVLGTNYEYEITEQAFATNFVTGSSVLFGCFSTAEQATLEVDYVKAFTF